MFRPEGRYWFPDVPGRVVRGLPSRPVMSSLPPPSRPVSRQTRCSLAAQSCAGDDGLLPSVRLGVPAAIDPSWADDFAHLGTLLTAEAAHAQARGAPLVAAAPGDTKEAPARGAGEEPAARWRADAPASAWDDETTSGWFGREWDFGARELPFAVDAED